MNTQADDALFAALAALRRRHPTMRFGQLVANISYWARGPVKSAVWDVEDDEFLRAAREHLQQDAAEQDAPEHAAA